MHKAPRIWHNGKRTDPLRKWAQGLRVERDSTGGAYGKAECKRLDAQGLFKRSAGTKYRKTQCGSDSPIPDCALEAIREFRC